MPDGESLVVAQQLSVAWDRRDNAFNAQYATFGVLGDPTGVGAPGIPPDGVTNGPGVDNRFLSPASPIAAYGGVRVSF